MRSLKTIQKLSSLGSILSKIAFILSVVGFCGCIAGLIGLRLGRDAVNLYRYEYDALASAGVLEDYRSDGFAILLDSQQYLPDVGLNVKEPECGAGIFI